MKNFFKVLIFISLVLIGSYLYINVSDLPSKILTVLPILLSISVILISFVIFLENRRPTQTITWLVVLASFPYVGFFFYIFFGRNFYKERRYRLKSLSDKEALSRINEIYPKKALIEDDDIPNHQKKLYNLGKKYGNDSLSFYTHTEVLNNGDETFSAIKKALLNAKHHIHLEYYIWRHDHLGNEIKDILIQKASEGVKIRLLYDGVGSLELSEKYIEQLKKAGVKIGVFSPVHIGFLNSKMNYRNHRKIVVVDGKVGFVGGLNVGDEYLGKDKAFGFWRDTHMKLEGDAVLNLQLIFLQDWYYSTEEDYLTPDYLIEAEYPISEGGVQVIASGPDEQYSIIKDLFFSMITSAQKSVLIASPYFIPDDDILSAIRVVALSGVKVQLLVPKKPDHKIVFYASRSYFPKLLEAGVEIYEYNEGFMHSKILIVDEELASIGTANMDMRSFHLNFEVNVFLYRTVSARHLVEQFNRDLAVSSPIDKETFKKRSIFIRLFESAARLFSPLL